MSGVQLRNRKRDKDSILMLGWNEAIDLLAMAVRVRWHGHELRMVMI